MIHFRTLLRLYLVAFNTLINHCKGDSRQACFPLHFSFYGNFDELMRKLKLSVPGIHKKDRTVINFTIGSFRLDYEYEIKYVYDFQISNQSHPKELSLLPVVNQQRRRL